MSVKKRVLIISAAAAILAAADWLLFVDATTGFVAVGAVSLRYLLLGLVAAGIWLSTQKLPKSDTVVYTHGKNAMRAGFSSAALCAAGGLCAVLTLQLPWMICGVLWLAGSLWLAKAFGKENDTLSCSLGGYSLAAAFLLSSMLQYLLRPASRAHLLLIVSLLSSLAAMLFAVAFLRVSYLPDDRMPRISAFWAGLALLAGFLAAAQLAVSIFDGMLSTLSLARLLPVAALGPVAAAVLRLIETGEFSDKKTKDEKVADDDTEI